MGNETERKRKLEFGGNGWEREAKVKFDGRLPENSFASPG